MNDVKFVPPHQIEKQLSDIWESLSTTQTDGKNRRMRACLFNLILVTDKNARAAYIRGIAERVIEKFPSRILFVTIDRENKEDLLLTGVSVLNVKEAASDIACDLIECEVSSVSAVRVPFILLPHLLPDLPVYLLWAEDPILDNPLAYQLEKFTTRLIFDSESTSNLPLFAKSLLHHLEVSQCDIADLNWARTESWRTLLIATFRSTKRLAELHDTRTIKLIYNAKSTDFFCHTRIQSIYLQGWLAGQLGWVLKEFDVVSKEISFHYEGPKNQPIEIRLIPEEHPEVAPGSISTFELSTYSGQHFLFTRNPQASYQVTLYISSKETCEMPTQFLFSKGSIGQTLVKEICQRQTSHHYLQLLRFVAGLEGLSLC
ncbi:MAG: glucose-6-phosphate dehydrogenase assembly protein OpcA [Simkania sp.]|nr:glucose-6-phosphate dehydrogenase assembly protein OpcA [Simkania sp.]